jgi:hypothetical protein
MRGGRPTSPPGVEVGHFSSRRTRNEEVTTHSASAMPANRSGTGVVLFSEHEENGPKKPHHPPPPLGVPEEQSPADLPAGSGRTPFFIHSVAGSTVGCRAGDVGDLRCWSERVPASRNDRRAAAQPGLDAGGIQRRPLAGFFNSCDAWLQPGVFARLKACATSEVGHGFSRACLRDPIAPPSAPAPHRPSPHRS